jgi:hypothetical protein
MPNDETLTLLRKARAVLDRYLFDEATQAVRDDVAEVCIAIDDALPDETRVPIKRAAELDRELADAAA